MRGIAQGNTVTIQTAAGFAPAVLPVVRDANAVRASGVRARVGQALWLRVGQPLAFSARDEKPRALAVGHLSRVVAKRELIAVAGQMALTDVVFLGWFLTWAWSTVLWRF